MNSLDLSISTGADGMNYVVVKGRANFEYAVPLRELAKRDGDFSGCRIDLSRCEAMDSTFMGVLTMMAMRAKRANVPMELQNASDFLKKLLTDLGVAMLFTFTKVDPRETALGGSSCTGIDALTTAKTIAEAHKSLVEADDANAGRFADVIKFAENDVNRLEKKEGK
ncbi:MAG: STAS domain-containing protein [Victivallaceae bacterium]|nr:STAS domain-containing protein [Victivallaceae bacterium]